jgi:hypothetical protein
MAIVYRAELRPSKIELITTWLDSQYWGGSGEVTALGAYRYDDPDGAVGVEGHLVSRDGIMLHLPLTYRGAPLDEPGSQLIGRLQHSVLGERFVYDGTTDPVAIGCLARAVRGEQQHAVLEIHDGDTVVGHREPTVSLSAIPGEDGQPVGCVRVRLEAGAELRIVRVLDADEPAGSTRLVAAWAGGAGVIAGLS